MTRFRKEMDKRRQEQERAVGLRQDGTQKAREQQLINKIIEIFVEREISFFDCFQHIYDPLNPS